MWKWPRGGVGFTNPVTATCVVLGGDQKTGRFSHHAHLLLLVLSYLEGAVWGWAEEPQCGKQDELWLSQHTTFDKSAFYSQEGWDQISIISAPSYYISDLEALFTFPHNSVRWTFLSPLYKWKRNGWGSGGHTAAEWWGWFQTQGLSHSSAKIFSRNYRAKLPICSFPAPSLWLPALTLQKKQHHQATGMLGYFLPFSWAGSEISQVNLHA